MARNTAVATADRFGIMLRVHRRHLYLPRIFGNFHKLAKGRQVYVCIQADRPTPEVAAEVGRRINQLTDNIHVDVMEAPFPLLDRKERYMEALQIQYARLHDMCPEGLQAAALWDDDAWLDKQGIRELRGHLSILEADRIEVKSSFLWDDFEHENLNFPGHWQALVWRCIPGDTYPLDLMTHCPSLAERGTSIRMQSPLWNAGYLQKEDRDLTWAAYKKAGKIDAHTVKLVEAPTLKKVNIK